MTTRTDKQQCQEHILGRLRQEMLVRDDGLAWIERERFVVAVAANEWAQAHGGALVTVDDVERVEGMAVGHVDYASKLALYVAEVVTCQPCRTVGRFLQQVHDDPLIGFGRVSPDA